MPRVFVGLELPLGIKDKLQELAVPIEGARWQRADQLHLTLCFLGNVDETALPGLMDVLHDLPGPPFGLQCHGTGCFGSPSRPRVLWAGVAPESLVARLHHETVQRVRHAGLPVEERAFRPHVTLARFGRTEPGPAERFLEQNRHLTTPAFTVSRVALFDSVQDQSGSRYRVLRHFSLTG